MARILGTNYTDTTLTGAKSTSLALPSLNYGADYRVVSDRPEEAVITNITSPLSSPERFRFAYQAVADVYKGSGVDPSLYLPSRKGAQILCQLTDVLPVTDADVPAFAAALPLSCHVVIKFPNNDLITASVLETYLKRMLAGLYDPAKATPIDRLLGIMRGSLLPTEL